MNENALLDSPIKAVVVPVTPFRQNCTVIWCEKTKKAAAVDPGGDIDNIVAVAEEHGVEFEKIMLTHGHMDHAGGTAELSERFNLPIEGPHREDLFLIEKLAESGAKYGLNARPFTPDRWLDEGDEVTLGETKFAVRHCPGHTPGHIIFFHEEARLALVGDVLFNGSVGRTDLPRGDHMTLIRSIRERLWPLGSDVTFISGHGAISTFGTERMSNPYVADLVEYD